MFHRIESDEEILWDEFDVFDISRFRKRIFELELKSEEDLDRLIAYLGFLKWELQIDSIFSDPKQTYRYHRFPHESNRSPHRVPFSEPKPYRPEPGERSGLNGPLIAQLRVLLSFLKSKRRAAKRDQRGKIGEGVFHRCGINLS